MCGGFQICLCMYITHQRTGNMFLNLSKCTGFSSHRSGWNYALSSLSPLNSGSGLYLDGFIEKAFSWELHKKDNPHKIPYRFPWAGFLHNPHNMPHWFDYYHSPQSILSQEVFQESLKTCRAIFVLSDYLKNWLKAVVPCPVFSVKHPTEPGPEWNVKKFLMGKEKNIIQLGYWLRDLDAICRLKTSYTKYWMPSNPEQSGALLRHYYQTIGINWAQQIKIWKDVNVLKHLPDAEYDNFLSCSVVYLNLYDSSANNAIIECVARSTPVMVNRHPAVVEYLGDSYPLYHDMYEDMPDLSQIILAHDYLKTMDKNYLSGETFLKEMYEHLESI